MRKIMVLLVYGLFATIGLQAGKVPENEASNLAKNFFYERYAQFQDIKFEDIALKPAIEVEYEGQLVYYAFNINPAGFILISAWDETYPVLAYSFTSSYDPDWQPANYSAWMGQYARQIRYAVTNNIPADQHARETWVNYREMPVERLSPLSGRDVEPLLTSTWDQGKYYNQMCPEDAGGPGGHCWAGCVATAMGQVMNYFRWPDTGTGSYTYECPPYGTLTANFDSTTYRWDLMETNLLHPNMSIAELLYHLGVSVDMVYGPDGSGMYNHKAAYSLRTYFKYSPETQYVFRDSTSMDWDSLIVAHLDQGIPMYYAGWSVPNINGHAFVLDGYQDSAYYHFNWGWGGSYDGYFYTDNLTPGGSNFNLAQELIIHAVPDTANYTYPGYCSGNTDYTTLFGTMEDGSGPIFDYQEQSDCQWLIAPADSIEGLTLEFLKYGLGAGDTLRVYDGETTSDPLLALLTHGSQPGPVDTDGNRMLVTFSSDDAEQGSGFLAEFSSDIPVYCDGNTMLTAQTDTLEDGSGPWDYQNNTQCMWMINPEGSSEVTLTFLDFETEEGYDHVMVYDLATQELLADYSGSYEPGLPAPVTSSSGKMFVVFITNYTGRADGFKAYYETDLVGIREDATAVSSIKIYPNPTSGEVTVEIAGNFKGDELLRIQDMYGRIIIQQDIEQDQVIKKLDLSNLPRGVYTLLIAGNNVTKVSRKIIIQ